METADMVSADTEDAPTVDAHMEDARDLTDTERKSFRFPLSRTETFMCVLTN